MTTKSRYINTITFSLVALTLFSGGLLMSSSTSAEDIVDEINITVPVSCSLSGTGMTSHTATIENGRYVSDIGTTTLKAFCNDTNGFAIYATGYTGDEIGQENSNKLVGTPSTIGNISTGTATSGDTSNWSMKLATTSTPTPTYPITIDNSFNAYKEVPNEYTKVAHRDSSTDIGEDAEGATLISTYASYISKTQAAGAYSGKVIYTLVHPSNEEPAQSVPCEPGKICYQPNTALVQGQMGDQIASNGESLTLWAPNFKHDGYGFAGWNTEYDYTGTSYGPNQDITTPADIETNGLSLYAIWIPSHGIQQNWNGCNSMNIGEVTALTDNRDNDTYAVAKLADGKCWTIENLRLDNTPELSSANTHNPSLPLTNSWWYSSENDGDVMPTSNRLSASATTWCNVDNASCNDQSMLSTNNLSFFSNNTASNYSASGDVYSYGNYYNWYSATAGHGKYTGKGGKTEGDICPAGWHLPTGNSSTSSPSDFVGLDIIMGGTGGRQTDNAGKVQSAKWRSYPNNYVYSGGYGSSAVWNRNVYGAYWTNYLGAVYFNGTGVALQIERDLVSPGNYAYYSNNGHPVRCVNGV